MISAALELCFERARTACEVDYTSALSYEFAGKSAAGLTVEVGMADVHVIHGISREAWRHLLTLFFEFEDYGQKPFDVGRRNVIAVGTLDERLALEVEDGN